MNGTLSTDYASESGNDFSLQRNFQRVTACYIRVCCEKTERGESPKCAWIPSIQPYLWPHCRGSYLHMAWRRNFRVAKVRFHLVPGIDSEIQNRAASRGMWLLIEAFTPSINMNQVPPIIITMLRNKKICQKYDLSSVRFVYSGAAPLGNETIDEVQKMYPTWTIAQAYGTKLPASMTFTR